MSITPSVAVDTVKKPSIPKTLYVGGSGGGNYTYIQDAINDSSDEDTVFVYSGHYVENLIVDKSITLIGEDSDTTIIDGNYSETVVYISADWVNINGFTIQNSEDESGVAGIYVISNNNNIANNTISYNHYGIEIFESSKNIITGNIISNNKYYGICLRDSSNNTITGNNIRLNIIRGICVWSSTSNTVTGNTISINRYGIYLRYSNINIITDNTIYNNWYGIYLDYSDDNTIKGNNIFSNNLSGIIFDFSHGNTFTGNIISNNEVGVFIDESWGNIIQKNNFLRNKRDSSFSYDDFQIVALKRNRWWRNYWSESRLLPKLIHGLMTINIQYFFLISLPWITIDWRPALKPYNIEVEVVI